MAAMFGRMARVHVVDIQEVIEALDPTLVTAQAVRRLRHVAETEGDALGSEGLPAWVVSLLRRLQPAPGEMAATYAQFNRTVVEFAQLYGVNELDAFKSIRDHHVCSC